MTDSRPNAPAACQTIVDDFDVSCDASNEGALASDLARILGRAATIAGWGPPAVSDGNPPSASRHLPFGLPPEGMHYFPLAPGAIGHRAGLLCVNHEALPPDAAVGLRSTASACRRAGDDGAPDEIAARGVSIVEICRPRRSLEWQIARSRYTRRITDATPIEIFGPVRSSTWVRTKYSPDGTLVRGTLGNGAHCPTPWDTYLACEARWSGQFVNRSRSLPLEQSRYGIATSAGDLRREVAGGPARERFDATPIDGADATQDYRNEPNGFGWVVEIDPFSPRSPPRKLTALGRLAHRGARFAPVTAGRPIVLYLGDDAQDEHLYKFVTRETYRPGRTSGRCLDEGTLYAARFGDDGRGEWLPLDHSDAAFRAAAAASNLVFEDQADVLVNTRLAADVVGATRMDRPGRATVDPATGEVCVSLRRDPTPGAGAADDVQRPLATPRGAVIRWRELARRPEALRFDWDAT